jgi:hypothetical protein
VLQWQCMPSVVRLEKLRVDSPVACKIFENRGPMSLNSAMPNLDKNENVIRSMSKIDLTKEKNLQPHRQRTWLAYFQCAVLSVNHENGMFVLVQA